MPEKSEENFIQFKSLRNRANNLIANAKKNFFKSSIENNQSDSKSLWKRLKQLGLPSKKGQPSCNIGINIDGEISLTKSKFQKILTISIPQWQINLLANYHLV